MPYADKEQQLAYQRTYMKRRRAINQIAKLMNQGEKAKELYQNEKEDGWSKSFYGRWLSEITEKIKRKVAVVEECDGLLKNSTECSVIGGNGKP